VFCAASTILVDERYGCDKDSVMRCQGVNLNLNIAILGIIYTIRVDYLFFQVCLIAFF
jgi:hypothetical protein